jgi:hypothetical protein
MSLQSTSGTVQHAIGLAQIIGDGIASVSTEGQRTVTHDVLDGPHTITAAKVARGTKVMSGGAGTIDLQACPGTNGAIEDFSGLKVQYAWFYNNSQANNITITFGSADPYNLLGAAFVIVLAPGQSVPFWGNDATPEVGNAAHKIDISGTLTQELEYFFAAS